MLKPCKYVTEFIGGKVETALYFWTLLQTLSILLNDTGYYFVYIFLKSSTLVVIGC